MIQSVFTDRWGGSSSAPYDTRNLAGHVGDDPDAVAANRRVLAAEVGVEQVVWMNQVHGDRVVVVGEGDQLDVARPPCDALVTAVPGVALGVLVADCVPVLMSDDAAGIVAAVHAGRIGTSLDVVGHALEAMVDLGAHVDQVRVQLGPAVCGACYEVPPAMQQEVLALVPGSASTTRWGTTGLDLREGVRRRLLGVVAAVDVSPICTVESADHFSHRRDDGVSGRTAGVVRFTR